MMDLKVIALFVFVAGFYNFGCSSTEIEVPRLGNKYYFIVKTFSDNWFSALKECQARNMELLKIESPEENEFVNRLLRVGFSQTTASVLFWWTAGIKFLQGESYYWSDTGTFIDYTNWANNAQTNRTNYDFVAVLISKQNDELYWDTKFADWPARLICEKTVNFP